MKLCVYLHLVLTLRISGAIPLLHIYMPSRHGQAKLYRLSLPFMHSSFRKSQSFGFSHQTVHACHIYTHATYTAHLNPPWFYHQNNTWKGVQIVNSPVHPPPAFCYILPLSTLFSSILSLQSPLMWHTMEHMIYNNNNLFSCNWAFARWQWSYTCTHLLQGELGILKPGGLHKKHAVATWSIGNHLSIRL